MQSRQSTNISIIMPGVQRVKEPQTGLSQKPLPVVLQDQLDLSVTDSTQLQGVTNQTAKLAVCSLLIHSFLGTSHSLPVK